MRLLVTDAAHAVAAETIVNLRTRHPVDYVLGTAPSAALRPSSLPGFDRIEFVRAPGTDGYRDEIAELTRTHRIDVVLPWSDHRARPRRTTTDHPTHPMIAVGRVLCRAVGFLAAQVLLAGLLVGVPWGLWHYIGWPLLDHLPTLADIETVLLSPLSTTMLLDLLACVAWPCWALFVLDVARCVPDVVRGIRVPALGPVHALAAALVTATVLGLFGPRTPHSGAVPSTLRTAPPSLLIAHHTEGTAPGQVTGPLDGVTVRATAPHPKAGQPALPVGPTVLVRAPHHGLHDSLWRIADRELGDGARWPDIFALNQDHPQPDGGTFTNPNLIFPGERMILPPEHPHPVTPPPPAPPSGNGHHPAPTPTLPPPTSTPAGSPAPPAATPAPTPRPDAAWPGDPDAEWEPAVFVSAGLAAAISAALLLARRRHRRSYRPGSGRRDDLPVAPVVYQLRLAHLRESHPGTEPGAEPPDREPGTEDEGPGPIIDPAASPRLGVRDGREIALNLATARGLGLAGPGALPAARALLLTLLAPAPSARSTAAAGVRVIVPEADLTRLLGTHHTRSPCPGGLDTVADLDTALDQLEALILHRAREDPADQARPPVVLVARPPAHDTRRLQTILDNGAPLGLLAVLLGQWRPGISAYVRAEGTVSATSPGPGQALVGARLFRLPEADAADLLALLHHTHPVTAHNQPLGNPSAVPADGAPSRGSGEATGIELEVTEIPSHPDNTADPLPRAGHNPAPEPTIPGQHSDHDSATTPSAHPHQAPPITITVLGPPRVTWTPDPHCAAPETPAQQDDVTQDIQDITAAFPPRRRELLVFLALHPDGVSRDVLVTALWEHHRADRPTNALNTTLSRLRRAIHTATSGAVTDLVLATDGRFRLDPQQVDVDYWHFVDAVTTRRTAAGQDERIAAYRRIVAGYQGTLAEGMDTEWIYPAREATRRDALDAVAALARALVDADPQHTLDLLETARAFDPHNELLYRDIMRLQHRLGRPDAIARTLSLLTTRLAEIDEQPTPQTVELATRLQHPAIAEPVTATGNPPA